MQAKRKRGNLYRRGEIWWGRIKVEGQEYRRSLRTTIRGEAEGRLATWRKEIMLRAAKPQATSQGVAFEEACVRWVTEVLPRSVKPSVVRRYSVSITSMAPSFAGMAMGDIDQKAIATFVAHRQRAGVTNSTIRRDLTALSRLTAACSAWSGEAMANAARDYDRSILLRVQRQMLRLPRREDIAIVFAAVPRTMLPILQLLDETGMRLNEAVSLEHWQIDWGNRTIRLTKTKSDRPRVISFLTPAGDAGRVLDAFQATAQSGHLFPNSDGRPYVQMSTNFDQTMRRVVAAERVEGSGFTRFRIHDLRHAFAVRWLETGGSIYRLQKHLGHSSIKTTEGYLDHVAGDLHDVVRGLGGGSQAAQNGGTLDGGQRKGAQSAA
jgi:integrase/recombinase XerD